MLFLLKSIHLFMITECFYLSQSILHNFFYKFYIVFISCKNLKNINTVVNKTKKYHHHVYHMFFHITIYTEIAMV